MINHVTVKVKDFEKEEAFYEAALTPLGYGKGPAFPGVQAITVGMRISRTPSTTTNIGVRMLGFLYSRSDLPSVRTRCRFCFGCDCTAAVVTFVPLTYSSFPVSSSCDVFRTVGCDSHSRDCRSRDSASHNARLE